MEELTHALIFGLGLVLGALLVLGYLFDDRIPYNRHRLLEDLRMMNAAQRIHGTPATGRTGNAGRAPAHPRGDQTPQRAHRTAGDDVPAGTPRTRSRRLVTQVRNALLGLLAVCVGMRLAVWLVTPAIPIIAILTFVFVVGHFMLFGRR